MVVGSIIVAAMLLVMAWTKEIVGFFVPDEQSVRGYTIALAVMSIYAVDFAINAGTLNLHGTKLDSLCVTDDADFQSSTILLSKSDCGHSPYTKAATWISMG